MTFFKFQLEYFCNQAELHATLDHCGPAEPLIDEFRGVSGQVVEDIALQIVGKFFLLDPKLEVAPSTNLITDLLTVRVHA